MTTGTDRVTRVVVIGAGAVGSVIATALAEAGCDVTVATRRPQPEILVEEPDGRRRACDCTLVTDPRHVRPADVVIVVTKAQQARSAAGQWFPSVVDERTTVVVVQNGVGHRAHLAGLVDESRVVPALAYISAERREDGVVVHHIGDRLAMPAGPQADRVAALLEPTRLLVRLEPDFLTASWRKLLTNVVASPVTALTGARMDVFEVVDVRELAAELLREAVAAGRAAGARLSEADVDSTLDLIDQMPGDSGSSMLADRKAGRPLEHEHLTGAVVVAAAAHGVAVPLNRAVLALLRGLDRTVRTRA